jgi:lycopene cyclase domain-containing protein
MNALRYLLILTGCVVITLPLELLLGARVYRRPVRLLATVIPVAAVFGLWDVLAVRRGDWSFNARLTLPLRILGLPLEEGLFFAIIPVCALLTYEAFGARSHTGTGPQPAADATVGRRGR